jgi:pyruvate, water dikinase
MSPLVVVPPPKTSPRCLGVDRGSSQLAALFDERHLAIKKMIRHLIQATRKAGRKVGICGEAPSNYPDFAGILVEAGINSISLNPDSLVQAKQHVARLEKKARKG